MAGIQGVSYSQIAEKALVVEQTKQRISRAQEARQQFRRGQGQRWPRNDKKKDRVRSLTFNLDKDNNNGIKEKPQQHTGAYPIETRTCYVYGKVGHLARACLGNPNTMSRRRYQLGCLQQD